MITERGTAVRALLRNPMLPSCGETAEDYAIVRRHAEWLKEWFTKFPAWTLYVDKDVARLRKVPADFLDETRPAVDRDSGTAFSRRRYSLVCLALAALERSDRQIPLRQIARSVAEFAVADRRQSSVGLIFDAESYDHRRDLLYAIRLLVQQGVLQPLNGDENNFLNRSETGDVVYTINRPVLASILNVTQSASVADNSEPQKQSAARAARLTGEIVCSSEETRSQWIRARLVRTLLDDPVLYFDDLNAEERHYFESHRAFLLREICGATGLVAEVRREGIALVDGDGDLVDVRLPEDSADGPLSLFLVQWLAERYRTSPGEAIPVSAIEAACPESAHTQFVQDALHRFHALRLIRRMPDAVLPLAACSRYAASEG